MQLAPQHHFQHHEVRTLSTNEGVLKYLLHTPVRSASEPMPLLLFLHGAGERGEDLRLVTKLGIPARIEAGYSLPFVAASPQCPGTRVWSQLMESLHALLDEVCGLPNVDAERIYLTGVSMGAYGIWKLASETPHRFKALLPVCGLGDVAWAPALRALPTWAFHGALDTIVPADNSRKMVESLQKVGAPALLTILDGLGHECWDEVYARPDIYEWLLAQGHS